MSDFELGYTPNNLRKVLKDNKLTQKEAYDVIGKTRGVFSKYLIEPNDKNFVSMNHKDWCTLMAYVKNK
ncbi:hypothetical protein LGZ99_12480 [Photorhabdus temperata]|uniref:XRE family transcriptional regulator n=1 Tax=Photorhabdus temperata subsp. temperata Meg1 TaxID=1393735 RepID=A0A081RV99_PHOTE|nr:hypothetical protein [Photorhabdus temperata]KER02602.1 hypothetical protein MEG1DRAFT_02746 [Photorhabdus temperata subsp. temperata Meg1]MCT8347996.1 hypothetical protein [Photorhabdus temperata]